MKLLRTAALSLIACSLSASLLASPITRVFRLTDTSGNPVSQATIVVGGVTLTAGTSATVTGKSLSTGAALTSPTATYLDFNDGTGEYALISDPAAAEEHLVVTASKSGVTISNPTFAVDFYADPSLIVSTNAQTTSSVRQADVTSALAPGVILKAGEYANIAAVTSTYAFDGPPSGTILALTITHNSSNQPVLTWVADPLATGYKVLRSTDGTNYTQIAAPPVGTLTFTDTARPNSTTVYYHIVSTH